MREYVGPFFHVLKREEAPLLLRLRQAILEGYLNASDEYRTTKVANYQIQQLLRQPNTLPYVIEGPKELMGFLIFCNVFPEWKAEVRLYVWNWEGWGPQRVRAAQRVFETLWEEAKLQRLGAGTADLRIKKILTKYFNFQEEGTLLNAFSWDKKLYNIYLLARRRIKEN